MGLFSKKKDPSSRSAESGQVEDKDKDKESVAKTDKVEVGEKQDKDAKKETKPKNMKELYGNKEEVKATTGKKSELSKKTSKKFYDAYRILLKPLITEKAANLGVENKYVFAVAPRANKIEIAKAIEEVYGIKPIKINIVRVKGKNVRSGRIIGKRQDWKKAIIALPAGKTIKVYEGV